MLLFMKRYSATYYWIFCSCYKIDGIGTFRMTENIANQNYGQKKNVRKYGRK